MARLNNCKDSVNNSKIKHPLELLLIRHNLKVIDVCRIMQMSSKHWQRIKKNYVAHLTINKLYLLSGAFGMKAHVLLYLLERNRLEQEKDKKAIEGDINTAIDSLNIDNLD